MMAVKKRRLPKVEIATRGDALYESVVRPRLTPDDVGKFCAIDVETSDFEVNAEQLTAGNNLRQRVPDAQIWMVRVGYPYVHRFGGRPRRSGG
jgi:hypothetical protein